MAASPKIVQFCTPTAGTIVVLTDTGEMYEREIDPRQFAGADGRKHYRWLRIDGPFAAAIKAATPLPPGLEEQVQAAIARGLAEAKKSAP